MVNLNFKNAKRSFVRTSGNKIQEKFKNVWLRFVRVAFKLFTPIGSHVIEYQKKSKF